MPNKALLRMYAELDQVRRHGTTADERIEAAHRLDDVAARLNRLYVSPTKRCLKCGNQMKAWSRVPWWRCIDDDCDGSAPKKRFSPDPPLTPGEVAKICLPIAAAMEFIVFDIDCSSCSAFHDENGQPIPGYLRHAGARHVYALDAILDAWSDPPRWTFDSRDRRLARMTEDGKVECWRCSEARDRSVRR